MYIGLHISYQLFLSDFNETGIFSAILSKKILRRSQVVDESFQGDRHDAGNSRF